MGQRLVNAQPLIVPTSAEGGPAASGRAYPAARRQQRVDDASRSRRRPASATSGSVMFSLRYQF
ncbi:MAG: hypothetical protein MZV64_72770 [Ignavibacteriales bacterium]|nr:hypothetical protein [Ignavibacteriales bacterium]